MTRAIITGAAGFIGGHLTQALLERGWEVVGIDDLSSGLQSTVDSSIRNGNYRPVYLDISDPEHLLRIKSVFREFEPNYVFHLAAIPGVAQSVHDPLRSNQVNVTGTLNMLDLARDYAVKRFIFSSSSSVYGDKTSVPTKESSELSPKSPYALQKKIGEEYCSLFSNLYGLETVCLRYFNVFGPRQRADSAYAAVISAFCDSIRRREHPVIYGDGEQSRDFCYVENVVHANVLAATSKEIFMGDAFNVGCGGSISVRNLCSLLKTKEPRFTISREGDVKHSQADISKAQSVLGYEPLVSLKEGLRRTSDWFLIDSAKNMEI